MQSLTSIIIAAVLLSGCASLDVSVQVLDSRYWSSPDAIAEAMNREVARVVISQIDGITIKSRESLKSTAHAVVARVALPGSVASISKRIDDLIDATYSLIDQKYHEAMVSLDARTRASNEAERSAALTAAWKAIDEAKAIARSLSNRLETDLRTAFQDPNMNSETNAAITGLADAAKSTVRGLVGDAGILDDARAAAVVYAPEKYWNGTFNQAYGRGQFGSTDIAVKMERKGDFTVKGVRLDSSKITQATFKVAGAAIHAVAAVYGVPLPTAGQTSDRGSLSIPADSPDRRKSAAEQAIRGLRDARLQLLESIASHQTALADAASAAELRTAIEAIQATFASIKPTFDGPSAK